MDVSNSIIDFVDLISDKDEEVKAKNVLDLMRNQHPLILTLGTEEGSYGVLSDITCQHIAEQGLKEILDIIKIQPTNEMHFYATATLSAIKEIHLVKKYLWKDKTFIDSLVKILSFAKTQKSEKFIIIRSFVGSILQALLLGGTPETFYEIVADSGILDHVVDILKDRLKVSFKQSYEEFLMTLLLLCQNNKKCAERCGELSTAVILHDFSQWEELDESIKEKAEIASRCIYHMANHDELPAHKKLILDKFSEHIHHKNKTFKRMEMIVCLNCGKVENSGGEERFKKCGKCRVALYCSKQCQCDHWKNGHSKVCTAPTASSKKK